MPSPITRPKNSDHHHLLLSALICSFPTLASDLRCEPLFFPHTTPLSSFSTILIARFIMAGEEVSGRRSGRKPQGKPSRKPPARAAKKDAEKTVAKKGRGGGKPNTPGKGGKPDSKKGKQQRGKGKEEKGRGKAKDAKGKEEKKPLTAEELDRGMDDYWQKSKDTTVVAKKLDDDMNDYWAKKGKEGEEETKEETPATEEAKPEEDKKEAATES